MVAQVDLAYIRTRPSRLWPRLLAYALFEGRPLTTKGRWFNRTVFGFAKLLRTLPPLREVEAPAFILGTGRSGTTILGIVLSMHRSVGFLNEPKALWAGLHPGEDLIGSYNRNLARYRLDATDTSQDIVIGAHRIYGGYLRLGGVRRVVDKYPEMIFRPGFLREIFPDARFIFLSRGSAATCGSIRRWSERLGIEVDGELHDWWGAGERKWKLLLEQIVTEHPDLAAHADNMIELDHEGRAAVEWIVTMREGLKLARSDPQGTLHVPYEALCADPQGWAKRLEIFLKLPSDPVFRSYAVATLADPERVITLDLPDWLGPIVNATEAQLKAASAETVSSTLERKHG